MTSSKLSSCRRNLERCCHTALSAAANEPGSGNSASGCCFRCFSTKHRKSIDFELAPFCESITKCLKNLRSSLMSLARPSCGTYTEVSTPAAQLRFESCDESSRMPLSPVAATREL
eukprot:2422446-Prymnesium_polylepis.4